MSTFFEHMRSNVAAIIPQKRNQGEYRGEPVDDARTDTFYPKQGMSGNKMGMYGNPAIADRGMTKTSRDAHPATTSISYGGKGGFQDPAYGPDDTGEPDTELQGMLSLKAEAPGNKKANPLDDLKKRVEEFKPKDPSIKRVKFHAWPPFQGTFTGQTHYTHTLDWKNVAWDKKTPAGIPTGEKGFGRILSKVERGHVFWHPFDKPKTLEFDSPSAFMDFMDKFPYHGLTQDDLRQVGQGKFAARSRGRWSSSKRPPEGSLARMMDKSARQVAKAKGVALKDDERNRADLAQARAGGDPAKDRIKARAAKPGQKVIRRKPKKTESVHITAERLQEIIHEEVAAYYGI